MHDLIRPTPVRTTPRLLHPISALIVRLRVSLSALIIGLSCAYPQANTAANASTTALDTESFIDIYCSDCHDDLELKGGLDLTALGFELNNEDNFQTWVKVFDHVNDDIMPPEEEDRPLPEDIAAFTQSVSNKLLTAELSRVNKNGRATRRRLNRYEYENALRDLLDAPWLQIKSRLPADAISHNYNKVGDVLDMSHVQIARYIDAAEYALREVMADQIEAPKPDVKRFYARDQKTFIRNTKKILSEPERMVIPVLGLKSQYELMVNQGPWSVGEADPETRELEAFVEIASQYESYEMWFDAFSAPRAGHYKLRFKTFTAWVGPEKSDQIRKGKPPRWWIPDLRDVSKGRRPEPVTVYAETFPRQYRLINTFDAQIEPTVHEFEAWLLKDETIHPDVSRLFRSRFGPDFSADRYQNPLATKEGAPGVGFRWLEVEGPLVKQWPSSGHRLMFDDMRLSEVENPRVDEAPIAVHSKKPLRDAKKLLKRFLAKAYRRPVSKKDVKRFLPIVKKELDAGTAFADSMIAAYTAVLCSPEFVTIDEKPGKLNDYAIATRLALFLQNSTPDAELTALARSGKLSREKNLYEQTERLLNSPNASRFINAFLDYWLDLRMINSATPDPILYNDYYLDDLLKESALKETQHYFSYMVNHDRPAQEVVDSNYAFINERLATHYGLPSKPSAALQYTALPDGSPRGGLLTQASIMKITTNGMTTSPVRRGVWVLDRILGKPPSPPPPNTPAVEADTRGATTIREQLEKHRNQESCAGCHKKIDPAGFALESFDVMGAWREQYRGYDPEVPPITGIGHGGQKLKFHYAQPVDSTGELADGSSFSNIREFKSLLLEDKTQIARNLIEQFAVYATGAPIGFSDRGEIERMLTDTENSDFGVRSLIHSLVQSKLFLTK